MTHALKTWPEYYKFIESGEKNFEIRKMDRAFKTGDTVLLQEYDPTNNTYTGQEKSFRISFILIDTFIGLKKGYCAFGLAEISDYA